MAEQSIVGSVGLVVDLAFGAGGGVGTAEQGIIGLSGIDVDVVPGASGAVLETAALRITRVFIDGIDRSQWVEVGITRNVSTSGGSKAVSNFQVTNAGGDLPTFRPAPGSDVVIYEDATRFFAGVIDTVDETAPEGHPNWLNFACSCVDYGALCDRRIIGYKFELYSGAMASIIMARIATMKLSDLGIVYQWSAIDGYLGVRTFNWVTCTEAFNQLAQDIGAAWLVDFDRNLKYVPSTDAGVAGAIAAPFDIADDDGNWAEMHVETSVTRKVNRQGVRNSQDLTSLWTDEFITANDSTTIFLTMAAMEGRPIVTVDGASQIVISFDERATIGDGDWDWLYFPLTIYRNPSKAAPPQNARVAISYPSPLSHIEWAADEADIAMNGLFEAVDEVKDLPSIEAMQIAAQALLDAKKNPRKTVTYTTWRSGLLPGMSQRINTTKPLCDATVLIQQIDSEEIGKGQVFKHTVRAATSQLVSQAALWQRLVTDRRQPVDRVRQRIGFVLAGTIEGLENPGLTTGLKNATATATQDGVARDVTIYFPSAVPTTTECEVDILMNGTSIFDGSRKMVWPAGAVAVQTQFNFASQPFYVRGGDVFTINVTKADAKAHDGMMILTTTA